MNYLKLQSRSNLNLAILFKNYKENTKSMKSLCSTPDYMCKIPRDLEVEQNNCKLNVCCCSG